MNSLIAPFFCRPGRTLGKQPDSRTHAPRRTPAILDQSITDIIIEWDKEMAVRRCRYRRTYFRSERCGDAFIGIDLEDPFAGTRFDPDIAALPLEFPRTFEKLGAVTQGNVLGPIATPVEHDHQFVGETD